MEGLENLENSGNFVFPKLVSLNIARLLRLLTQTQHAESLTRHHMQMTEAKRMIEDRQMAVAVAKREFHEQLEARDEELTSCRELLQQLRTDNDAVKAAAEQAKQSGT